MPKHRDTAADSQNVVGLALMVGCGVACDNASFDGAL